MAAFHYQPQEDIGEPPTRFRFPPLEEIEEEVEVDESLPSTPSRLNFGSVSAPTSTPRRSRMSHPAIPDTVVDPSLFTPTKRGGVLRQSLASSSSGSFLVDSTKITSSQLIPPPVFEGTANIKQPDWLIMWKKDVQRTKPETEAYVEELVRELETARMLVAVQTSIIEGQRAQLVLQNLQLVKQNEVLHVKENAKENDRTKLFPGGRGRHLTGDDFHEAQVDAEKEKRAKEAAKELRKDKKAFQKKRKDEIEKLWKKRIEEYQSTIEKWTKLVTTLRCTGTKLKDCPKKPGRPKKADVEDEVDKILGGG